MGFSNRVDIKNKIFSKEKVILLIESIYDSCESSKAKSKNIRTKLECIDGTVYVSNETDRIGKIKKDFDKLLDTTRIVNIDVSFYGYDTFENLELIICEGSKFKESYIKVSDPDYTMTSGMITKYQKIIDNLPSQFKYISIIINIAEHLLRVVNGYIFINLIIFLYDFVGYVPSSDPNLLSVAVNRFTFLRWPVIIMLSYGFGFAFNLLMPFFGFHWIEKYFPSVELNFGYSALSTKEKIVKLTLKIVEIIIIPTILGIIISYF